MVEEAFQLVPATNVEPLWGENVARLGMPAAHTHAHTRRHPLLRGCSWGHACGVVSPASPPPPNPPIPEHCTTQCTSLSHTQLLASQLWVSAGAPGLDVDVDVAHGSGAVAVLGVMLGVACQSVIFSL